MALIHCDFYSEVLGTGTAFDAIIPMAPSTNENASIINNSPLPTLFLLHGLQSDYTAWTRYTSIERYAEEKDIAVVMPDAGRSFYTNMHKGYRYFDFFADELPRIANRLLPISERREDRFIAGLSMGGYGAFKIALSRPDQYRGAASLSGALSFASIEEPDSLLPEWPIIFGPSGAVNNPENDLILLAREFASSNEHPMDLFQCCGTEDFLYNANRDFLKEAQKLGIDIHYEEEPGEHEWGYWDMKVQSVLDWLPTNRIHQPDSDA